MERREFVALVGGSALAWPLAAFAQQSARIGYLSLAAAPQFYDAFREGLRDFGYVEGKNIHVEYRDAEGDGSRISTLLKQLIDLEVDVI